MNFLLFTNRVCFLRRDELLCLNGIKTSVPALTKSDFSFEISMSLAEGKTKIIAGTPGKPADLFRCVFSAFAAGGRGDNSVLHSLLFGRKGF